MAPVCHGSSSPASYVGVVVLAILCGSTDCLDKKGRSSSLYGGQQHQPGSAADSAASTGGGSGTGRCVYNFEVWTPNQNVLERLRQLEDRCDATKTSIDSELQQLRSRLLTDSTNLTHRVEKSLLEQQVADAQQDVAIRDLRLELIDLRSQVVPSADAWAGGTGSRETAASSDGGRPRSPVSASGLLTKMSPAADINHLYDQVVSLGQTILQVKHGVGDLKAEWLLMKRDLQEVRVEHVQLKTAQAGVREDATRLKAALDIVKSESARLKATQDELLSLSQKLKSRVAVEPGSDGSQQTGLFTGFDTPSVDDQLTELRLEVSHLYTELTALRVQYEDVNRHVLNAALRVGSSSELTRDDVSKLIDKMSMLMNRTALQWHQQQTARQGAVTPKDCDEVYKSNPNAPSGVYQIRPNGSPHADGFYCEMVNGSGWTVVQRRVDGTVSFRRPWNDYKHGFGGPYGEFWIGTETLHRLTSQRDYRLRIDMWDWEGGRWFAEYDTFRVNNEQSKYRMRVRGYHGDAGNSLSFHDDMAFSTVDSDNDYSMRNCADDNKSGWWFSSCLTSNLNGVYHQTGWYTQQQQQQQPQQQDGTAGSQVGSSDQHSDGTGSMQGVGRGSTGGGPNPDGIVWFTLKETDYYSLKRVEMKIKPSA